ncbi:hypothetical protein CR513_20996, partial [Mucuna pruriens]
VYCDTSYQGLGYVLMQQIKVVAYASRKLKPYEKSYRTHGLKLTLPLWSKFDVFSDHKSLKYLFDQKELNMR